MSSITKHSINVEDKSNKRVKISKDDELLNKIYNLLFPEGSYRGTILNNLPHGKGIIRYNDLESNKIISYEGEWNNGYYHGFGIIKYNNGIEFDGQYLVGIPIHGVIKYNDSIVELNLTNRINNIYTIYCRYPNIEHKQVQYIGTIKNFVPNGDGIMFNKNGKKYIGKFKNGQKHGYGTLYLADETKVYEGYFENDSISGRGIFYYSNGNIFEGEFKNNKKEGKGIIYYLNGDRFECYYKNDKKIENGISYILNKDNLKLKQPNNSLIDINLKIK